jgi:glycosyltransferase involved in cell wall biosynthesis
LASHSLYILNPHRDDFIWEPLYFRFLKRRALKKYNYIADVFSESNQIQLLVNDTCSGIIPQKILSALPAFLRKKLISLELNQWKKHNQISADIVWLDSSTPIKPSDELLLFQLSNLRYINELTPCLIKFRKVYVHLSHFYLNAPTVSETLKHLSNVHLCGDSDLSSHAFFKKYFPWYKNPFILLPFYIQDRFTYKKNILERSETVITTGTYHPIEDYPNQQYIRNDWNANAFHFNRRFFAENKSNQSFANIHCLNSAWLQKEAGWLTKLWNANKVSQKKYFNTDIVEEYNKHQFALIGEEVCGFPGIGSFEAMACGCITLMDSSSLVGIVDDSNVYVSYNAKDVGLDNKFLQLSDAEKQALAKKAADFIDGNLRKSQCTALFKKIFLSANS